MKQHFLPIIRLGMSSILCLIGLSTASAQILPGYQLGEQMGSERVASPFYVDPSQQGSKRFPVTYINEVAGAPMIVAMTGDLIYIPHPRLTTGMLVYVVNRDETYRLTRKPPMIENSTAPQTQMSDWTLVGSLSYGNGGGPLTPCGTNNRDRCIMNMNGDIIQLTSGNTININATSVINNIVNSNVLDQKIYSTIFNGSTGSFVWSGTDLYIVNLSGVRIQLTSGNQLVFIGNTTNTSGTGEGRWTASGQDIRQVNTGGVWINYPRGLMIGLWTGGLFDGFLMRQGLLSRGNRFNQGYRLPGLRVSSTGGMTNQNPVGSSSFVNKCICNGIDSIIPGQQCNIGNTSLYASCLDLISTATVVSTGTCVINPTVGGGGPALMESDTQSYCTNRLDTSCLGDADCTENITTYASMIINSSTNASPLITTGLYRNYISTTGDKIIIGSNRVNGEDFTIWSGTNTEIRGNITIPQVPRTTSIMGVTTPTNLPNFNINRFESLVYDNQTNQITKGARKIARFDGVCRNGRNGNGVCILNLNLNINQGFCYLSNYGIIAGGNNLMNVGCTTLNGCLAEKSVNIYTNSNGDRIMGIHVGDGNNGATEIRGSATCIGR